MCLLLTVVLFLAANINAIAQTGARKVYTNEHLGFSFEYDASFTIEDNSTGDRLKLVLKKETYFVYVTLMKQGKGTPTPFVDFVAGLRSFTSEDTASKQHYKMGDLAALKKDISGKKAYTFSEFYSFDNGRGPMTNHYIFMEFPFKDNTGVCVRARTFDSGLDFYMANDDMMAVLGSFKKL